MEHKQKINKKIPYKMYGILVVEPRGFVGSDSLASVIAKKVNLFTFRSVSPQGFARHRRGTNFSKFAQSPWK